ncbi:MAG: zinc ribbon domain-containing protein [Desulfobacteraceae bacterium]|nr:MAG: zinc ribbon domain-containing protein [Desulfobacteraceae bacterium]
MPLFDYECAACGKTGEYLVSGRGEHPACRYCGSQDLTRKLSAHAAFAGTSKSRLPGLGDTTCCGSSPGHGSCAGPGSCCGKN